MKGRVKRAPGGKARTFVGVRLALAALEQVIALAAVETDGNLSEMIRRLLSEALAARAARVPGRRAA